MGLTVDELINDIGGGCQGGTPTKAVQIGGPSGGCLPAEHVRHARSSTTRSTAAGAVVGSGGMVVVDETTCMVDLARYFLAFTQDESCGKCVPCRIGTKRMLEIVTRITEGKGEDGDIEDARAARPTSVKSASLCGLGRTAPNPVLTTLRYFRDEYEEHIHEKKCRAKACTALSTYVVDRRGVQGLRRVQEELSRRGDLRRAQGVARHRHREVHQVRHLRDEVPVRRDHEGRRRASPEGSAT